MRYIYMLRRRKKKGATRKLTSLQKVQLHVNKNLGRPTGKLPVLNDQEFLMLQNKMMALRNEKIASTNKNFSSPVANVFQTPLMLNEPTYPQQPSALPIGVPPVISAGYETIDGQIIPAILPSAAEHIGVRTKQIGGPNENQKTTHSVGGTFGMHAGAGVSRKMTAASRETPVIAQNIMRPPEYIGPSIAVQKSQVDRYEGGRREQELARGFKAAGIPVGQDQQREKAEGIRRVGKPAGSRAGDITNKQIKLQEQLDKARASLKETEDDINKYKDGMPGMPKDGKRWLKKMNDLDNQKQKKNDTLARREEEMKSEMAAKGYARGERQILSNPIALGRSHRDPASSARFERMSEGFSPTASGIAVELGDGQQMHPDVITNSAMGYVPQPSIPPIGASTSPRINVGQAEPSPGSKEREEWDRKEALGKSPTGSESSSARRKAPKLREPVPWK
jgi:hypothetical protein